MIRLNDYIFNNTGILGSWCSITPPIYCQNDSYMGDKGADNNPISYLTTHNYFLFNVNKKQTLTPPVIPSL